MIANYVLTCHEANAYIYICSFLMTVNQDTAQRVNTCTRTTASTKPGSHPPGFLTKTDLFIC